MIVYTVRGGVSAVIWTDVVQMFVYLAGALLVFCRPAARHPRRLDEVVDVAGAAGKFQGVRSRRPIRRRSTRCGRDSSAASRSRSPRTDGSVPRAAAAVGPIRTRAPSTGLVLSGFIVFVQFMLFLVIGVMLYVHYQQTPLPRPLLRNDEILPLFVITSLPHGIAGFIVAAIVAAALSPSINALAATTVNDFYVKYVRPDASQDRLMRLSRRATIVWGIAQIAVGARGAVRHTIRARFRACRAVARRGARARRVPDRRADATRRRAGDAGRHARGSRRRMDVVDGGHRLDLVCVHRRDRHRWRRASRSRPLRRSRPMR